MNKLNSNEERRKVMSEKIIRTVIQIRRDTEANWLANKDVVLKALDNPRRIDMNLVHSGEARRFLDRIIGFRLSKVMQSKTEGKSAGRVQSVTLKLIVDKEREILAFVPKEYWTIEATFDGFVAKLDSYKGKEIEITQVYEPDNTGDFAITSKVEHETKINKTPQNDMIVYDIVKLIIISLLENSNTEVDFQNDFGTVFAINTLLSWGILEEKEE